jgi:hypothetical protein
MLKELAKAASEICAMSETFQRNPEGAREVVALVAIFAILYVLYWLRP